MANKTMKTQGQSNKAPTPEEIQAMMVQVEKDAALPSLLYVTRKLGEVEGIISMQADPDEALIGVQKDLKRLHNKLIEDAGLELMLESKQVGSIPIGGDI